MDADAQLLPGPGRYGDEADRIAKAERATAVLLIVLKDTPEGSGFGIATKPHTLSPLQLAHVLRSIAVAIERGATS